MFLNKSTKFYFLLILAMSMQFTLAAQEEECDLACKYKKLQDLKSDEVKRSNTPSYQDRDALISNTAEVQRWLNEITEWKLYYDGEPLNQNETEMKVGSVRGDKDGFKITDFELYVDGTQAFKIKEISARDYDFNGFLNSRPKSFNEFLDAISGNVSLETLYAAWTAKLDQKVLGIELGEDIFNEFSSDPDTAPIFDTGLFDSVSYTFKQEPSLSEIFVEAIMDFGQAAQLQIDFRFNSPTKKELNDYYEEYSIGSNDYWNNIKNFCYVDYDEYLSDAEEEIPYSVFVGDFLVCSVLYAEEEESWEEISKLYSSMQYLPVENFSLTFSLAWSPEVWDAASVASGGTIDAGIFAANTFLATKMSKFELVALLDGLGIPYEYKGLFEDLLYDYYSDFYSEAKKFVSFPRGLAFSVEVLEPINPEILIQLEDNPMLFFNILNKIRFEIKANPRFKNL